jgi:hypothetical protein
LNFDFVLFSAVRGDLGSRLSFLCNLSWFVNSR